MRLIETFFARHSREKFQCGKIERAADAAATAMDANQCIRYGHIKCVHCLFFLYVHLFDKRLIYAIWHK